MKIFPKAVLFSAAFLMIFSLLGLIGMSKHRHVCGHNENRSGCVICLIANKAIKTLKEIFTPYVIEAFTVFLAILAVFATVYIHKKYFVLTPIELSVRMNN